MSLSPMMQQYNKIKKEHEDSLLMFRLGDFYELFFDDAHIAARELELTLTGRNCGLEERAPMCGVPHHSADSYINKLVKNGHKVAICEQLEDPASVKGIVKRDVVRIITPGTLDASGSDGSDNIFLAALSFNNNNVGLAFTDISTGELICMSLGSENSKDLIASELSKYQAREIICHDDYKEYTKELLKDSGITPYFTSFGSPYFSLEASKRILCTHFGITSVTPLGIEDKEELICAAGSLLMYLVDTQKQSPSQITELTVKNINGTMQLDKATIRNLELLENLYDSDYRGSLFGVLNKTKTAMGARLLKVYLKEPLNNSQNINERLNAVEEFYNNDEVTSTITDSLKHVYDFQRLTAKIASKHANAKDLIALKTTLSELPIINEELSKLNSPLISKITDKLTDFDDLYDLIDMAIEENPPFTISEGGIIKLGYSSELDDLKASIKDAKLWITNLEATEKEKTGIKTLKVGFNKVFGYYIDVSKGMASKVPEHYVRKQTLVNNERYITPELKEKESLVLTAETKINKLEYELFSVVRDSITPYIHRLQKASEAVAEVDVLISFAKVSKDNNYIKPIIDDSDLIEIKNGRHPTVEKLIGDGLFVSNDTYLDNDNKNMLIITGPNMAGKSTYMRQTAIIVIMAQIGCFVPCDNARIGVVDRVFTRIGASDNLSHGQSTFYIEMSELANILRNATSKSLVILDEIGRGTSTFDGLSIAWATASYLCKEGRHIRSMFATHYHELTELASEYPSIHNLSVAVSEDNKNIVFLHNIVDGPASKSYGIHVAKLAGVPKEVRQNAAIKLRELEATEPKTIATRQLNFIDMVNSSSAIEDKKNEELNKKMLELTDKLTEIDINIMTPINAQLELSNLIALAKRIRGDIDD